MFWVVGDGKSHINVTDSTTFLLSSLPLQDNQKMLFLSPVMVLSKLRLWGFLACTSNEPIMKALPKKLQ